MWVWVDRVIIFCPRPLTQPIKGQKPCYDFSPPPPINTGDICETDFAFFILLTRIGSTSIYANLNLQRIYVNTPRNDLKSIVTFVIFGWTSGITRAVQKMV